MKRISDILFLGVLVVVGGMYAGGRHTDADVEQIKTYVGDPTSTTPVITTLADGIADIKGSLGGATQITSLPFTTSASGIYLVVDELTSVGNGITVAHDNVVIDLGDHTLDGPTGSVGVIIQTGHSNVTVKNGRLRDFATGIDAEGTATKLVLENVQIDTCTAKGIDFSGGAVTDSVMNNIWVTGCTGATVVDLTGAVKARMVNCQINDNSTSASALTAVLLNTTDQSFFNNVQVVKNSATGGAFIGFDLNSGDCLENVFENCVAKGNSTTDDNLCTGFNVGATSVNNVFKNCQAISNFGSGDATYGFNIVGSGGNTAHNMFIDCLAHKNFNDKATGIAIGFRCFQTVDSHFVNCIASDNQATGATGGARGFDFDEAVWSIVENCSSLRNINDITTGGSVRSIGYNQDPSSAGIAAGTTGLNVFIKNIALANGTGATGTAGLGAQYAGFEENQVSVDGLNTDLGGAWHNVGLTGIPT